MEILHKLGVVRGGSYKWKGNAKDRPIEAIMDNVYDKEKDLVYKEDFSGKKPRKEVTKKETKKSKRKKKQSKILFWIMLPLSVVFVIAVLGAGGFSLWFVVSLFLWFAYLYNIRRSMDLGVFSLGKMIVFGIIIVILSVLIVDAAPSEKTTSSQGAAETESSTPQGTEEEEQNDEVSLFLQELEKETALDFGKTETEEELLWHGPRVTLKLNESRSARAENNTPANKQKIVSFFESLKWNHGTIGFTYTPENGEIGYASTSIEQHKGMMCIIDDSKENRIKVSCGFGPR